jgi:ADP-ribosylglycohydrolase
MKNQAITASLCFLLLGCSDQTQPPPGTLQLPVETLEDKIRGGFLGQLLGNLNGLPHEMKYIDQPGQVADYVPSLPEGARSDDDTDIEWIYVVAMQEKNQLFLSPEVISNRWKAHINERIWCSNRYARKLMDIEVLPPLTGRIALNPWAIFNISGQFICESFGLISPAMPETAARLGLHYTHVTIDGEPAQTTQLFTTMIATAFVEEDIEKILQAGLSAIDPSSEISEIVEYVYQEWKRQPRDWQKTREAIRDKYSRFGGETRDRNGYELNTASTIASLLYGKGDFVETLRLAFNFGWDADNNAATSGTIVGVIKGQKWMDQQGWEIKDLYRNVTRDGMPMDETITSFGDRLVFLARKNILDNGGQIVERGENRVYYVAKQELTNVEPLPDPLDRLDELRTELVPILTGDIQKGGVLQARAAYYLICLDESKRIRSQYPELWRNALNELGKFPEVIQNLYEAPGPTGEKLRELARAAGLEPVAPDR